MKLAAYLRVSTDKQVEQGMGLEVQEQALKKFAKAHGHKLVGYFRDEGVSGSNGVDTRIGLHEALAAIQDGEADGLLLFKLDRLARQLDVQEATLATVWKQGGSVFTCDIGEVHRDDPDDPMRTAMRQMIGVFAQLERGMITSRMRAGRKAKADRGGFAYGSPGYGYASKDRALVPEPEEAETLARIRDLRTEGKSLREVIEVLDQEGRKPKRGGSWNPGTLSKILRRVPTSA